MPQIDIYTKQQVDAKIPSADELVPDTTGASQGDVLTVGASGTEWSTPSGGVTKTTLTTATQLRTWLENANIGDEIIVGYMDLGSGKSINYSVIKIIIKSNPTSTQTLISGSMTGRTDSTTARPLVQYQFELNASSAYFRPDYFTGSAISSYQSTSFTNIGTMNNVIGINY